MIYQLSFYVYEYPRTENTKAYLRTKTKTAANYNSIVCLNPRLADYLLTGNTTNFLHVRDSICWLFLNFLHFCMKLIKVLLVYQYTIDPKQHKNYLCYRYMLC